MPRSQYAEVYKLRKKAQGVPKDKTSMSVEGPNVVDLSEDKFPKLPPKQSPQLPVDDPFLKYRTEQI